MKILALELSTSQGSLAWLDVSTGNAISQGPTFLTWPNDRKNSGPFFDNVQRIIRRFGLPDKIIVGLGPGSYAGVRIAISAAIGLRAAAGGALIGYPSVCAVDVVAPTYVVIGDARRRSFFLVTILNRNVAGEFELYDDNGLRDRLSGFDASIPVISSDRLPQFEPRVEQRLPSAEILGQLVTDANRNFSIPPLEPVYLREANVTMPKPIVGQGAL